MKVGELQDFSESTNKEISELKGHVQYILENMMSNKLINEVPQIYLTNSAQGPLEPVRLMELAYRQVVANGALNNPGTVGSGDVPQVTGAGIYSFVIKVSTPGADCSFNGTPGINDKNYRTCDAIQTMSIENNLNKTFNIKVGFASGKINMLCERNLQNVGIYVRKEPFLR